MSPEDLRYAFIVEWFDVAAELMREYTLFFWPNENAVQMTHKRGLFLKKTVIPHLTEDQFVIGNHINVFSRQLKIVCFADKATENMLGVTRETVVGVCNDVGRNLATLLGYAEANKYVLTALKSMVFPPGLLAKLGISANFTAGTCFALLGKDIRKNFLQQNGLYLTADDKAAYDLLFEKSYKTTALVNGQSSICLVKPSALQYAYQIVEDILASGLEISAAQMFTLSPTMAKEFMEVYKGVVVEYNDLVAELTTGGSIALEVTSSGETVKQLRELAGPHDPSIGKHIRPNSMRSKYGVSRIQNAVHVTDLVEDGVAESEYFFRILQ